MHSHNEIQDSPYSTRQLFDLVIDIERYPDFLPWCRAARILEQHEDSLTAELVVCFKHITESYTSRVTFKRPASGSEEGFINVDLVQGPFNHLRNYWKFIPEAEGSQINLHLAFEFRSRILDSIIGLLFEKASAKMATAFKERANMLYSKKS